MSCKDFKSCNLMKVMTKLFMKDIISFLEDNKVKYNSNNKDSYIEIPTDKLNDSFIDHLYLYGLIGEGYVRIKYSNFIYLWVFEACKQEVKGEEF